MDFKPVLRMMVCSDIHFGEPKMTAEKFEKCVEYAYTFGHLDAFVAVGDFVNSGEESEFLSFKSSLDRAVRPDTEILLAMASHEYFSEGVEAANEKLYRILGKKPMEHADINGFSLIAASTDDRCQTGLEKQEWIKAELKKARDKDPKKPIFFFFHPQFQNTVYGSAVLWRTSAIMRTVMNYPQTVAYSGHSHAPVNDPRNVHQRHFTCFGTGSILGLSCCNADRLPFNKDVGSCQFLIVEADQNNRVRTIAVDGTNGKAIREWIVENPSDPNSFIYTDERYLSAKKPVFPKDAELFAEYKDGSLKVSVTQATDGAERVPGYHFIIKNESGLVLAQFGLPSGYHLYDLPEKAQADVDFEAEPGCYSVECRAVSFFDLESDKLVTQFKI